MDMNVDTDDSDDSADSDDCYLIMKTVGDIHHETPPRTARLVKQRRAKLRRWLARWKGECSEYGPSPELELERCRMFRSEMEEINSAEPPKSVQIASQRHRKQAELISDWKKYSCSVTRNVNPMDIRFRGQAQTTMNMSVLEFEYYWTDFKLSFIIQIPMMRPGICPATTIGYTDGLFSTLLLFMNYVILPQIPGSAQFGVIPQVTWVYHAPKRLEQDIPSRYPFILGMTRRERNDHRARRTVKFRKYLDACRSIHRDKQIFMGGMAMELLGDPVIAHQLAYIVNDGNKTVEFFDSNGYYINLPAYREMHELQYDFAMVLAHASSPHDHAPYRFTVPPLDRKYKGRDAMPQNKQYLVFPLPLQLRSYSCGQWSLLYLFIRSQNTASELVKAWQVAAQHNRLEHEFMNDDLTEGMKRLFKLCASNTMQRDIYDGVYTGDSFTTVDFKSIDKFDEVDARSHQRRSERISREYYGANSPLWVAKEFLKVISVCSLNHNAIATLHAGPFSNYLRHKFDIKV